MNHDDIILYSLIKKNSGIEIEIREDVSNLQKDVEALKFSMVGKDVSNETYIIDDVEYSGGLCGEIFNDYTNNKAIGELSHAEGFDTLAFAIGSHSEGIGTKAIGNASHAEGIDTRANGVASHACGKYNIEDVDGKFIFIIGNGESDESRSNAFSIDYDGLIYQGNSSTGVDLSTKADKSDVYTKSETDVKITEKVAEIVADAPEDFDTLKEMSDWISSHEEDASAMNSAILANTSAISGKVDKVTGKGLSTEDFTTAEKSKLAGLESYALPVASADTLGGVKVGEGLSISDGVLSVSGGLENLKIVTGIVNNYVPESSINISSYGFSSTPFIMAMINEAEYSSSHYSYYHYALKITNETNTSFKVTIKSLLKNTSDISSVEQLRWIAIGT